LNFTVFTQHTNNSCKYNWLIKEHVLALFGHHQAYKEIVLFKVHSLAIPIGSHGLHWTLCLFKINCFWL